MPATSALAVGGVDPQPQLEDRAPDHLVARVAEELRAAVVHVDEAARRHLRDPDGDQARLEDPREALLGLAEIVFRPLPGVDVEHERHGSLAVRGSSRT